MNETLPLAPQSLFLTEIFRSVQGESSLAGLPTTFIRTARCNLRCHWCDTTYSFGRGTPWSLESIVAKTQEFGCKAVCVTGGEPLLQQEVLPLMTKLCDQGHVVSLETGGSLPIQNVDPRVRTILDIKCPGSGMADKNHWENLKHLRPHDEVKFVIVNRSDYDYAKDVCEKNNLWTRETPLLFSPAFNDLEAKQLVGWMLEDKIWARLNLQLHKFVWSPETKGV